MRSLSRVLYAIMPDRGFSQLASLLLSVGYSGLQECRGSHYGIVQLFNVFKKWAPMGL